MNSNINLDAIRSTWSALHAVSDIGPIRDAAHYEHTVALADQIIETGQAQTGELADLFGVLCELIAQYDEQHYPVPVAPPREVLRFLMQQHGLTQADLPEVGTQGVVSEILSGRRMLNARQIAALVARFGISAEALLEPVGAEH
ncbi:MAG: transcriptional regulator [Desulfobulbus sp.]|nr:transcriptional regulator [Desulfobulbus sp.]